MSDDAPERKPYDMLEDETAKAYNAFMIYKNLGPERTIDKVRQKLGRPERYLSQLQTWSTKHNWVERAEAWDKEVFQEADQEYRENLKGEIRDMMNRHGGLSKAVQDLLEPIIEELKGISVEKLIPEDPTLEDVLQATSTISLALQRAIPLERESHDVPGHIEEERTEGLNDILEQFDDKYEDDPRLDE